jgi:hypothetical protein
MAKYLVSVEYSDSTLYRTYEVDVEESEKWLENNLDYIEARGEVFDEDVQCGPAFIVDIKLLEGD